MVTSDAMPAGIGERSPLHSLEFPPWPCSSAGIAGMRGIRAAEFAPAGLVLASGITAVPPPLVVLTTHPLQSDYLGTPRPTAVGPIGRQSWNAPRHAGWNI